MRILKVAAVVIFVLSLGFYLWADIQYKKEQNTDFPTITAQEETLEVSVDDGKEALLQGLTAQDETDGDLTDEIMVTSISHFLEKGTVNVKYVVFDSHNNAASLTRKVRYTDYHSPEFSLKKAPVYTVGTAFDLTKFVQVTDCIDGDITDRVRVISNMVNNFSVGIYPLVLEVSNSCGDTAQISLLVRYVSEDMDVNVNLSRYIVYLEQGEDFDPMHWVSSVTDKDGNALKKEDLEVQGTLDTQTPGTYSLVYSYDDGKQTGQSAITVVVAERQG